MNPNRQTAHNTHPTTYSTGGPACLGQSRERTDFPSMVFSFDQSRYRVGSLGCQGEQPWPLVLQRGRNRPPMEGIERSEQPSPTNTKGQGCEAPPKHPLATHKLGRENNLQNNTQNRGGVPARTGVRYTPGHPERTPQRGLSGANCRGPFRFNPCAKVTHSPVLPTSLRADQFRAASLAVFWVVDPHRRHLSLFPRIHHGHPQTQTPFTSNDVGVGSYEACPTTANRLAAGLPKSHSGLEEEGRPTWSERLDRSDTLRVGRRSGVAQLAVTSACHPCVRGVSLKTPLDDLFLSLANRIFPRVSQSVFPSLQTSLFTRRVEAFCSGWSRHRFATLVSSHSQGSDFGSSAAGDSDHLKAERDTSCFKTPTES